MEYLIIILVLLMAVLVGLAIGNKFRKKDR